MTLWINGDWVTGEGEQRVKTNPVGKEVLWKGNDASAAQVEQACHAARRAFRRGQNSLSPCAGRLLKSLPGCWRQIRPN